MQNVLISYPSWDSRQIYLPYIFGLLKTFCDRDPELSEQLNWMMPVYGLDTPDNMLPDQDLASVDVLGLSCYTWNWFLQCEFARRVRRANPDCLIVAGGPHCDYEDPDFFEENPWLDVVVKQDGQVPFREILRHRVTGEPALSEIPGLYLPDRDGVPTLTSPPELLDEEDIPETSPYQAQSEYFRTMLEESRSEDRVVWGIFETNRGCPYHCSFCDWGSLTFSNVRKYPMARIKDDIRWITENEVPAVHLADANVGIFERDVEVMDFLGRRKQEHGAPYDMIYSPTKSRGANLPEIMRKAFHYGLKGRASFPLQHTDPDVLDAMDRTNLPREDIDDLLDLTRHEGISILVQLILGSPNDTYERWKRCLSDLMVRGVDGEYVVYDFEILPNAPAAREEYREEHGIKSTLVEDVPGQTSRGDGEALNFALREIITATDTYDEDDWCRMWVYTHAIRSLHTLDLTRKLALYMHYREGVSFGDFYDGVVEELGADKTTLLGGCLETIFRRKRQFLADPSFDHRTMDPGETMPEYETRIWWRDWLFMECAMESDRFYEELGEWLTGRFSVEEGRLRDLLRYQKHTLVTPDYDPGQVKVFPGEYDWKGYFQRPRNELQEDPRYGPWRFTIAQQSLDPDGEEPIDWHQFRGSMRIESWYKSVVRWVNRRDGDFTTHEVNRTERPALPGRIWNRARRSLSELFAGGVSPD